MIAVLAASAFLITQTYDGKSTMTGPMSEWGCRVAKCVALYDHACSNEAEEEALRQSHKVLTMPTYFYNRAAKTWTRLDDARYVDGVQQSASSIKTAVCVK